MATGAVSNQTEAQSFQNMRERLAAVADPRAPVMDANATALRALVVADWMAQPDTKGRLVTAARNGAFDPRCIDELRDAARSIVYVLSNLADRSDAKSVSKGVREEAQYLRQAIADRMADRLQKSDDATQWLGVARSGQDDADLLFDLRILDMLFRDHHHSLKPDSALTSDVERAAELAKVIGSALGSEGGAEWLDWLARGWTLLANLFERVNRVGRDVLSDVPGMTFPSLAALARTQRQQKIRDSGASARLSQRPAAGSPVPQAIPGPPPPAIAIIPPPLPLNEDRITPIGETFTAATEADLATLEPIRRAPRFNVELQVDIFSDSNFYAGFTENLSAEGIFVATHVLRPMGSIVEMSVQFPSRKDPVRLRGQVRWVREYSPLSDTCPGMGIRFEQLLPEDDEIVREFLRTREPLFFDE